MDPQYVPAQPPEDQHGGEAEVQPKYQQQPPAEHPEDEEAYDVEPAEQPEQEEEAVGETDHQDWRDQLPHVLQ